MIRPHKVLGRSLAPKKSDVWIEAVKDEHKLYNKRQRQLKGPELDLKSFCYICGIDLSGRTKVNLKSVPKILQYA